MTRDAKLLKEVRSSSQGVLGKYRIAESGFHEALDRFRVIRFHEHVRGDTELREKLVDD